VALPEGQQIAAEWYGLAPFWWGWILAGVAIAAAAAAWFLPSPNLLAPRPQEARGERYRLWLWLAVAAALALHAPGFLGEFNIFDDYRQIHWEPRVNTLTWDNFWYLLTQNHKGANQQLMFVSFQLNWALAGKVYALWYLFNWLALVPLLLLVAWVGRHVVVDRHAAALAALLFACSPIVSELMCWVSTRNHLYGLMFALLSVAAYLEYRVAEGRGFGWLGLSIVSFGLSMMGKPVFLYLPLWLILLDVYQRRSTWWWGIVDKIPYFAVAFYSAWRIIYAGAGRALIRPQPLGGNYVNTILQDFNHLVEYLHSLLVPIQSGVAPPFNEALGWLHVKGTPMILALGFPPAASLLILLAVLAIVVAWRVRHRDGLPLLWLLMAAVTFGTVLNIPNRGPAATFEYRYTFSAQVITAIWLADVAVRFVRGRLATHPTWRHVPVGLVVAYVAWSAVITNLNTQAWRTSEDFWVRNAEFYPHSYYAHYYAGKAWQWESRNHAAIEHLLLAKKYNHKGDKAVFKRLGDNCYYVKDFKCTAENWKRYRWKPSDVSEKYLKRFGEAGLAWDAKKRKLVPAPEEEDPAPEEEDPAPEEEDPAPEGEDPAPEEGDPSN